METNVKEITINGVEYVAKDSVRSYEINTDDYVIVRTYSAGVFAGVIIDKEGKEVQLKNARRLWYWEGAASLSQLAMEGTSKPDECKFPCEVDTITLTEAVEIIPCTKKAVKSIKGVAVWKA